MLNVVDMPTSLSNGSYAHNLSTSTANSKIMPTKFSTIKCMMEDIDTNRDRSTETGNKTMPTSSSTGTSPSIPQPIIAISFILVVAIVGTAVFVIVLLIFLRKKIKNKNSKGKAETACYYVKTETSAEAINRSPQDYYSTVNKSHTSDTNDGQGCDDTEKFHNTKNVFQVYDDIDKEVTKECAQPIATRDDAEDITQMYAVVDKSAKQAKKLGQEKENVASDTEEGQEFSGMYAVVDKKAKKRSQNNVIHENTVADNSTKIENCSQEDAIDEYAVVNKCAANQIQDNIADEYAVVNKSAANQIQDSIADVYAVVNKCAKKTSIQENAIEKIAC